MIGTRARRGAVAAAGVVALVTGAAWTIAATADAQAAPTSHESSAGDGGAKDGVTTTILGVTEPPSAGGQALSLQRVVLEPGARLEAQLPAGTQVARVEAGRLADRIASGTVSVERGGGRTRTYEGPATVALRTGDTVIETAGVERSWRNRSSDAVRVLVAALLPEGAELTRPAGAEAPGTPLSISVVLTVTDSALTTVGPGEQHRYGTVTESGTSDVDGEQVRVDVAVQVRYTNGNGPFWGVLTLTFADGSTLGASFTGATVATEGGGARFASTVGVIGGTGRYAGVTGGTGTYEGSRPAAVATEPLTTEIDLHVVSG